MRAFKTLQTFALSAISALVFSLSEARAQEWVRIGVPEGDTFVAAPECFSWVGDGAPGMECYVMGRSGAIWRRASADGLDWSAPWQNLAGAARLAPDCISGQRFGSGQRACFATFADNALWMRMSNDGGQSWGPWESLGGGIASRPSCVNVSATVIHCLAVGPDGNIHTRSMVNTWQPWRVLGNGEFRGDPTCTAPLSGGAIECFARAVPAGYVRFTWQFGAPVLPTTTLPFTNRGALPMDSWNCLEVSSGTDCFVFPASAGSMLERFTLPAGRWTGSIAVGGTSGNLARTFAPSCIPTGSRIECYTLAPGTTSETGSQNQLWRTASSNDVFNVASGENLGGDLIAAPSCVAFDDGVLVQCFGIGTDFALYRMLLNQGPPPAQMEIIRRPGSGEIRRCRPPNCP